jgi:AraC-like DNA-binding protein
MGGWLLAGSAIVALISARLLGLVPRSPAVGHAINLTGFVAYPLIYMCLRHLTGRALAPGRIPWLWLPAAAYVVVVGVRSALNAPTAVEFEWILPVVLGFTVMSVASVVRPAPDAQAGLVSARWIVAFLVVLNVAQVVRMVLGHVALVPAIVPLVMTGGFVGMVGLVAWRALELRHAPGGRVTPSTPRYEKSSLSDETAEELVASVQHALAADRLFADPHLTLGRLAAAVGATPHRVSEALNRRAATSFHDLVCHCRVADVKMQLADPANDGFTIEGIGASAGFGSRSALYAAFRRIEGLTPTEFRAKVRALNRRT